MIKRKGLLAAGFISAGLLTAGALFFSGTYDGQQSGKRVSLVYDIDALKKMRPPKPKDPAKVQAWADAMEYMHKLRANDPTTGYLNINDMLKARQQVSGVRQSSSKQAAQLLTWEELGPDNVGGRTRAVLVDPNNSNRLFAGSVTGGLFVSNNAGSSWEPHPLNFQDVNHSISSMVRSSNGNIYFGTGESWVYTGQNQYGHLGGGVYRSTDNGVTFEVLAQTVPAPNSVLDPWSYVNELAVNPTDQNALYAAAEKGFWYSNDNGDTWSKITTGIAGSDVNAKCQDVQIGTDGHVHVILNNKYYRSETGFDFANTTGNGFPTSLIGRVELAVSPQDPNYVYASVASTSGSLKGVYRSTDNGVTWEAYSPVNSTQFNPLGNQGTYDNVIAVSPVNKDKVYIGGQTEMVAGGNDIGWRSIASSGFSTFTNPHYIHADMHEIAFDPNNANIMYVGSDGGINKTLNSQDALPNFTTRNSGYNVTQFYDIAGGLTGEVMAGAQDNGTSYIDYLGNTSLSGVEVSGGDGGYVYISKLNPNALFAESQMGALRRSSNKGGSFANFYDPFAQDRVNSGADFIMAYDVSEYKDNAGNPQGIIMIGLNGQVLFTPDALNFSGQAAWYSISISGFASSITAGPNGTFFVGTKNGNVYKIMNLRNAVYSTTSSNTVIASSYVRTQIGSTSSIGNRYITGIAVNQADSNQVVVTLSGYGQSKNVMMTTNANAATPVWTSIQGDLPLMPAYDAVIDYYNANNIIVATDLGVWSTSDGATWTLENAGGLSTLPIYALRDDYLYDFDCRVIYAAAYGRGAFRSTSFTSANRPNCKLTPGATVGISDPSVLSKLKVYPNPVDRLAYVDLQLEKASNVEISIVDMLGRVYQTNKMGTLSGTQKLEIDLSSIATGSYLITIRTGETITSRPIVVIK